MKRRADKAKKVRGHKWSQVGKHRMFPPRPPCFVCGEEILHHGISLLVGHTAYSKTGLPTKIGQLMGEGFMVVVNTEDMLCRRCASLLNHLDKLEVDLLDVKSSLMNYLKIKYQLIEENYDSVDSIACSESELHLSEDTASAKQIKSEILEAFNDLHVQEHNDKNDASGSDWDEGELTKKVNVEIILDEKHGQRRNLQSSLPHQVAQYFEFKCDKCGFGSNDFTEIQDHQEACVNYHHVCRICGKKFVSSKNVQDHILQSHLSKWTCHFCSTSFSEESEFIAHMQRVHITDKSGEACSVIKNAVGNYECNICNFECADKIEYDDHIRKHVVLKPFKCKECLKRFEDESSLEEHYRTHKLVFKCQICSSSFSDKSKLSEHMKQHSGQLISNDDLVVWDDNHVNLLNVDKAPVNELELKTNDFSNQKGEGMKFLSCSFCSVTFLNNTLYDQHMKNHSDVELPSNSKDDIMDTDSSLISSLVDTNNFDSVIDGSLEDMFEKMHSQVESSENKPISNFVANIGVNAKDLFRCELSTGDILKSNDEPQVLPSECLVSEICVDGANVKKFLSSPDISKNEETLNVNSVDSSILNQSSFSVDDKGIPIISQVHHDSYRIKSDVIETKYLNKTVAFENIYSLQREEKSSSKDEIGNDINPFSNLNHVNGVSVQESKAGLKKTYVCAECGFRYASMACLREHFKVHKKSSAHLCTFCNKSFISKLRLKRHLKAHEKTVGGKMTCPNCYIEFPDYLHLFQHMQEKHQKEKIVYKCEYCNKKFSSRKAFKAHEEMHPERFEFKCDECNQSFMKGKQLKDHKDSVHRDPHCRYCGKEIIKLKTLRNHELRHLRDKDNFECDVCKRVFKTKTGLRHHVAVHTGEYKYCCDYCGRGFMSRMMMEEHRSMHTKEERYVCDVCGRKFSFQSTYWIHRKWHDNPYPYKCSYCNRMFRHSSLLAVHKRKHTGERPYQCPHCPLSFPVGGTLKRHLILHTGKYPFNCDSCKRGFTTRHKYATHLAKVHGDYDLLNTKQSPGEYKMVIREEPKQNPDFPVWSIPEESQQSDINYKLEVSASGESIEQIDSVIPCSIVADDMLVDGGVAARVVEIVLDDESQAVATVTLAEPSPNMLSELWYQ